MMRISAKTPIAANTAPMMILVGFIPRGVDLDGEIQVNWRAMSDQQGCGEHKK